MTARPCHRCRKSRHPGWIMEPTPGQPGDVQWDVCPDCGPNALPPATETKTKHTQMVKGSDSCAAGGSISHIDASNRLYWACRSFVETGKIPKRIFGNHAG